MTAKKTFENTTQIKDGRTYVYFIPPSWLIVGECVAQDEDNIMLRNAAYIENVGEGVATLAIGLYPKVDSKVVTRSYPIPDGTLFKKDGILIACPCDTDTSSLYAANEANAIRGRR